MFYCDAKHLDILQGSIHVRFYLFVIKNHVENKVGRLVPDLIEIKVNYLEGESLTLMDNHLIVKM